MRSPILNLSAALDGGSGFGIPGGTAVGLLGSTTYNCDLELVELYV